MVNNNVNERRRVFFCDWYIKDSRDANKLLLLTQLRFPKVKQISSNTVDVCLRHRRKPKYGNATIRLENDRLAGKQSK